MVEASSTPWEEVEDALVDGDVAYRRGTAQAALRHRNFRIVYSGAFLSNIGTWMQNVILGAYALDLTHSGAYVGLLFFAQLGPLLFLSTIGGALADEVDRRRLLVTLQLLQGVLSLVLAALVWNNDDPSRAGIVAIVFAIGIANALGAPGLSSILPTLVPREDMPGAVALMSVQMNLSRVIGPVIGALLYTQFAAGPVFAVNAATYLFAVVGLTWAHYNRRVGATVEEKGMAKLLSGVRIARADRLISHILLTLFSFSFFSLAFVGVMPVIAKYNLGIAPKSVEYGLLYAVFGFGAALGAVSVGTVLARRSKVALIRPGFIAFAVTLAIFGLLRNDVAAFPTVAVLGYVYFLVITCLSTVLQVHLDNAVRGRVMALWIMGFGGTVPLGVLAAGPFTKDNATAVLLIGAVWALLLALWSNAKTLREKGASDV
ncbi:MAG TPA: MFS transporter [Acidimicrobiia bacterium]|nr:MFS transporter [Acidimicrobiia bacterium]